MVEFKELGEICEIKGRIGFRGYTREDQVEKGEGAISLSPGNITNSVLNYDTCTYITWDKYEESPEIMVSEGDIILCKTASVGKVARVRQLPEKATINPQLVLIKNIKTNPQYLFYVIDDNPFQSKIKELAGVGSVPNVSQAKLGAIQIPVPSVSEQNRIVGILDTFTASIENLKEQIKQRRKQYEYYRDQLLDLEGKEGVEMKTLREIFETRNGYTPSTNNKDFWEGGLIPWFKMEDIRDNGRILNDSILHITPQAVKGKGLFKANSIILATSATIGEHALITIEHLSNQRFTNFYPKKSYESNINMKFVYYYMYIIDNWCKQHINQGGFASVDMAGLYNLDFPILPLSEQSRIVSILDTFETSISNLEAQLKQREKQYEYYRNKLLTFE